MELEQVVKNYQNRYLLSTPLYTDMGGGLNVRVSPAEAKVSQAISSKNVIYNAASGALRPRDGTTKLITAVWPQPLTHEVRAIFQAPFSSGKKFVLASYPTVGMGGKFSYWTGAAWAFSTGTTMDTPPASKRGQFAFYNNTLLYVDGTNPAMKVTDAFVASALGGSPPTCKFMVVWNDYVVMAGDGTNKVYYSEKENPESWPTNNYIVAGGNTDGDPITGLAVAYGHLIVFKRNSIFAVSGATETDFNMSQIGRSVGLVAEGAHCNAENDVWFLGPSGMYSLGTDLSPTFQSDYVLPRYQTILSRLSSANENLPSVVFNASKQQIWVSVDYDGDLAMDRVMVHDLINKDASGRPAVSEYFFYNGGSDATNLTPKHLTQYISDNNEMRLVSMSKTNYVYLHDVPLSSGGLGDDGNSVAWEWQSKYLNLGDPMRLKTMRYHTVMGDSMGGDPVSSTRNHAYSISGDSWSSKAYMSNPRRGVGVCAHGGLVYVAGGYTSGGYSAKLEVYNPATDQWAELADMPASIAYGQMVSDGTYLYYVGGATAETTYSAKIYRYDPIMNAWSSALASMSTARCFLGAEIVGTKIYAIGGYNGSVTGAVEEYDIVAGTWSTKTSMATPRYLLTCTAVNGKIYAIGGFPFAQAAKNEEYDPVGNSWATKTVLSQGRYEHSAVASGGKVYVFGGYYSGASLSDVVEYDPAGDSYAVKTSMLAPRYWAGAAVVSGVAYVVGGIGLPASITFSVTNDFTNLDSVSFDMYLNERREIPATANFQKRYWSMKMGGYISDGVVQITGWNLDYTMFQRRN